MQTPGWTRRQALRQLLLGPATLGLRGVATGLPAAWIMQPSRALADAQRAIDRSVAPSLQPQFLILSTSAQGDPLSCNAPGTYADTNIVHPSDPSMAATSMQFGSFQGKAAAPWANLSHVAGSRTSFIHHATGTVVHNDEPKVLALMDNATAPNGSPDNFTSVFARRLATPLGTVQVSPVCIGAQEPNESVSFGGSPQPMLTPRSLSYVLGKPNGPLGQLQAMRNADLTRLNQYFREHATAGQRKFIDMYITSQGQVDNLSDQYLNQLAQLTDNSAQNQCTAAILLAQMKVAPVFTVHIPFGGDNHFDGNLNTETSQTVSGVGTIQQMAQDIAKTSLADQITFASLNVFGRTMAPANVQNGRSHNAAHHVTLLMGANVNAGVIGGVAPANGDYGARSIDSVSGQAADDGDISATESLSAVGKTIGAALGIAEADLNGVISGGKVISAVVKS